MWNIPAPFKCIIPVTVADIIAKKDTTALVQDMKDDSCVLASQMLCLVHSFVFGSGCLTLLRSIASRSASPSCLREFHLLSLQDLPQPSPQVTMVTSQVTKVSGTRPIGSGVHIVRTRSV